jgi:stage II sporulation protein D
VAILDGVRTVEISGGPMMVGDGAGRPFAGEAPAWIRATQRQGQIEVLGRSAPAVRLVPMIGVLKVNKREYPGALEIVPSGESLVVINELPLEDYLAGAVKAEAGDKMPMEMLKAQAIVARTYAAYHRQLNESKPYHIVASTAHQQYLGMCRPTRRHGRRCARRRAG